MKRLIIYLALIALFAVDCMAQSEKALQKTNDTIKKLYPKETVPFGINNTWAYGFVGKHYSISQMFIRITQPTKPDYDLFMVIGHNSFILDYVKSEGNNHYFQHYPYKTIKDLREDMEEGEPYSYRIFWADEVNGVRGLHEVTCEEDDYIHKVLDLIEH